MEFNIRDTEEMGILELGGDLTIQNAVELRRVLLESRNRFAELQLVLKKGAEADIATLQLLCSAHRTSLERAQKLVVSPEDPEGFRSLLKQTGYERVKGCRVSDGKDCLWVKGGPDHE